MSSFVPKEDLVQVIMNIGFTRNVAVQGLFYTGNHDPDLAAAWILENQDKNLDSPLPADAAEGEDSEEEDFLVDADFHKMVFVVNSELKMGVGKSAAQVAHAAVGMYRQLEQEPEKFGGMLLQWEQFGETKVVLKGNCMQHLTSLAEKASSIGLPNYIVQDAGKTQVPSGSITVVAIMGKTSLVDQVTGDLTLLT